MAKVKAAKTKQAPAADNVTIRHARIELDDANFSRLKRAAKANGLSVAAYIRRAVLQEIRRDEQGSQ